MQDGEDIIGGMVMVCRMGEIIGGYGMHDGGYYRRGRYAGYIGGDYRRGWYAGWGISSEGWFAGYIGGNNRKGYSFKT